MILLNANQTAYVISLAIAVFFIGCLVGFLIYRNNFKHKRIRELTYLKLRSFCEYNDYLLLNNYRVSIDDKNASIINHIVISDKYIILINDFALSGVISGDFNSDSLIQYNKHEAKEIANPLNLNINLAKRLSLFNDLSLEMIKGLVVINDDSIVNIKNVSSQFKIIRLKDLKKEIKAIDSEPIKKLKEEDVVRFINYLNENNK